MDSYDCRTVQADRFSVSREPLFLLVNLSGLQGRGSMMQTVIKNHCSECREANYALVFTGYCRKNECRVSKSDSCGSWNPLIIPLDRFMKVKKCN